MNIPYVFKKCTKCGKWLVASKVNFNKHKTGKYGLNSTCKKCRSEQGKQYYKDNKYKERKRHKQYYEDNKNKILERHKQYYEDNKDKRLKYGKQWYEDNKDKRLEQQKQWHENNKDKKAEYNKQWYENNKDKKAEQQKQWYENNKDKIVKRHKQWYENNKEKISEWHKQYSKNNKEKISEQKKQYHASPQGQVVTFNSNYRRRIKEQNQGDGINKDQWLEMMEYFGFRCAYSGKYIGGKENQNIRSIDHIKPLNKGGKHEVWNCVPMDRGLNSSKQDKDMEEWYQEQDFYSEERLQKIYEWQEYAYNKWHKEEII